MRARMDEKAWKRFYKGIKQGWALDAISFPKKTQDHQHDRGRYTNIVSKLDNFFPDYNANRYYPAEDKTHVVLEGPAQFNLMHSKRFLDCLNHPQLEVTDVIVAGNPLDGRVRSGGFLDYFSDQDTCPKDDLLMREMLQGAYTFQTQSQPDNTQIQSYVLTLTNQANQVARQIRIHQLAGFVDFGTQTFSVADINKLIAIYESAKVLAIHCSAGMGRSGVLELAFTLFANYDHYFPENNPDFKKIKHCLDELRALRPALVQTPEQLRMAIALGQQCHYAKANALSAEKSEQLAGQLDAGLIEYLEAKKQKKRLKSSSPDWSGYRLYTGESSGDEDEEHTLVPDTGFANKPIP